MGDMVFLFGNIDVNNYLSDFILLILTTSTMVTYHLNTNDSYDIDDSNDSNNSNYTNNSNNYLWATFFFIW